VRSRDERKHEGANGGTKAYGYEDGEAEAEARGHFGDTRERRRERLLGQETARVGSEFWRRDQYELGTERLVVIHSDAIVPRARILAIPLTRDTPSLSVAPTPGD
jgi:hypothetical protein